MDLRKNEDGSVDIYVGPTAPAGFEKNWIPTVPGRNWFAYFRFYQPTEAYFDRSWPLPDFEQISVNSAACMGPLYPARSVDTSSGFAERLPRSSWLDRRSRYCAVPLPDTLPSDR
jgi:hypothetical protein